MECNIYLGLDPGKKGALVFIDASGVIIDIFTNPLIGNTYDLPQIKNILLKYKVKHAVLEDVHAHQLSGKTSAFEFGGSKYLLEMALVCLNIPYTMIQAKEWQSETWRGVKRVEVPTNRVKKSGGRVMKVDTKSTSLIAVQRLFPNQKLTDPSSKRAYVPHDGIVDAILIAEYCRRKFN